MNKPKPFDLNLCGVWSSSYDFFNFICDIVAIGDCFAGKSRSVIAYLIEVHNMKLEDVLKLVYEKRPIVCPNDGFMKFLYKI